MFLGVNQCCERDNILENNYLLNKGVFLQKYVISQFVTRKIYIELK